jgi:hypothetical protein
MEQVANISRLTKGRPRGQPTNKMNYKLYFYDPMKTEYNYLGEYTTFIQMAEYFKNKNLDITNQVLQNIYNNKTTFHNLIKIEHI